MVQNLILFILFMVPILILLIFMVIRIIKYKKIDNPDSVPLITEDYVDNLGSDKKDFLEKSYSVYQHNIVIYLGYIAFFFTFFSMIIKFYNGILEDITVINGMTRYLFYLIASSTFTFFLFIYLNMINTYVQILNSKRLIDLIEQKENKQYYKMFENGYYSTTSDVVKYLNIFNILILIISAIIVLYGMINSVDTETDAYIMCFATIILIIICIYIVNKTIHKRIPKKEKNTTNN